MQLCQSCTRVVFRGNKIETNCSHKMSWKMEKFHTLEVGVFNVLAASLYRFSSDYISFYVHIDWVLLFFVLVCHLSLLHIKFACNGKLALVWKRRNGVFPVARRLISTRAMVWSSNATNWFDFRVRFMLVQARNPRCLHALASGDECTWPFAYNILRRLAQFNKLYDLIDVASDA